MRPIFAESFGVTAGQWADLTGGQDGAFGHWGVGLRGAVVLSAPWLGSWV